MNINRLIWLMMTALFLIAGAMIGAWLGSSYVSYLSEGGLLKKQPILGPLVVGTLTLGMLVLMARAGSWLADHHINPGLRRLHQLSAIDRVLSIVGVLLGTLFAVLLNLALPSDIWWLPFRLCAIAVFAALGMALMQGMRAEMLRAFPQFEPSSTPENALSCTPKLLDTNVIIDGRMADLCKTGFIEGPIYVPNFVLNEVQYIADSSDSMRRARGRRGLEVLNTMRQMTITQATDGHAETIPVVRILNEIPSSVQKIDTVDAKLVFLAKELNASIVTNDYNLNRVAELQGVRVLNINELAQALKPVVLPGEEMDLTIVKEGKEPGQGVGYLEDGTMVVVGDGNKHVGETCRVVISSVYQTLAGKMIFADIKGMKGAGDDLFNHSGGKGGDDFGPRPGGGMRRKGKY
ncbi:MAG: PIN domain-containing protein [Armatimonadota bacterium]|nr:PIN domain-containing protein [Armatimonadota bacterium]